MKKKFKLLLLLITFICLVFIGIMFYIRNVRYTFKLADKVSVNLNDPVDPAKYIKDMKNVNVYYESIDTSKAGIYKIKYTVKTNLGIKKDYYLEVEVIDNTPVIKVEPEVEPNPEKVEIKTTEPVKNNKVVSRTSSKGYKVEEINSVTYVNGILIANKTFSLPSTYNPGGLTSETKAAADEMFAAAKVVGFEMKAQSGFRSYETQRKLYNNYVNRDGKAKADMYSARPGHSEHQTGLAFDVCAAGYACINSNFNGTAPANWLANNAHLYGFILRYPKGKTNETGYLYESWHFRYVGKELAAELYNNGDWISLENYLGITSEYSN